MTSATLDARPAASAKRHGLGFWAIAFAYLAVMALGTIPSPLYPIYQQRDGFSTFTITIVFAAYAAGVVVSLFLAGHVSDWHGRRRILVPALVLSLAGAAVFLLWPELPGLLVARVLNGLSVGVATATATAWLAELHAAHRPHAGPRRAQVVAIAVNLGGLGVGTLLAGLLAEWAPNPLRLPYVVILVALALALVGVLLSPDARSLPDPKPRYRPQRVAVPAAARPRYYAAAAGAFLAFGGLGLFTGLTSTFLAVIMHHPSRALAGVSIFLICAAGAVMQIATPGWSLRRCVAVGMVLLVGGMLLAVVAAWLDTPNLALFVVGAVVSGAGAGSIFKGVLGTTAAISTPEGRAEALAGIFLSGYLGLSIPVIGLGIALRQVSPRAGLLGFAVFITLGIVGAARWLLGDPDRSGSARPVAAAHRG
ncbi:MFS transporter [Micromonospora avicenniae]|uniref:Predicted arabinose efflux permease, MFS family n=1 Tax=Micromonospora avicenniae TaxID=1198245 RepID=A0A1N6S056_9ACTN|nr:MFS transporter [Micromonospora avicenniae]SIQ34503.1 Predicted arabinose efflux permease, MFS family [Micromonospora avicenniae]